MAHLDRMRGRLETDKTKFRKEGGRLHLIIVQLGFSLNQIFSRLNMPAWSRKMLPWIQGNKTTVMVIRPPLSSVIEMTSVFGIIPNCDRGHWCQVSCDMYANTTVHCPYQQGSEHMIDPPNEVLSYKNLLR